MTRDPLTGTALPTAAPEGARVHICAGDDGDNPRDPRASLTEVTMPNNRKLTKNALNALQALAKADGEPLTASVIAAGITGSTRLQISGALKTLRRNGMAECIGSRGNAYTSSGIFGMQGFANLQGNDAVNKQIQAFMASTGSLDTMLGKGLTPEQIARITGNLAGYNRRTDGQPAEFAFSKDDQTASAQLTLEFLKAKYGVVFDEIDKTFADFIRGYTGKSEDLVQQIGSFAQLINSLAGTNIQGLNLTSLRAMQADGEELTATMQRVAEGFSAINGLFLDETDAYVQALGFVQSEFDALGIDMPINADSFKTLRDSLDLSTAPNQLSTAMHPDTLTLDDAADMLKTTPDTVAECIHHRGLPAAKVGRAWVLVREDVIAWLRTQYPRKDNTACDSTAAPALTSGTPTSSAQTANALARALAPATTKRRRNGPPKLRTIAGGREN